MFMYYDSTYILIIIGLVISMMASGYVRSTFNKYAKVSSRNSYTGTDTAQMILKLSSIKNVEVLPVAGELTDHYHPRNKTLNLSEPVYRSTSISAISVAAHECGHAIQDKENYAPLRLRAALVPVVNLGSNLSMPLILLGLILGSNPVLINLGILLFSFALVFQIVTLPVEFNASNRALNILEQSNILDESEMKQARKVLFAAALTYVAATIATFLQLVRLLALFGNRRD